MAAKETMTKHTLTCPNLQAAQGEKDLDSCIASFSPLDSPLAQDHHHHQLTLKAADMMSVGGHASAALDDTSHDLDGSSDPSIDELITTDGMAGHIDMDAFLSSW